MTFIKGCKLDDLARLSEMGISPRDVAQLLVECFSTQTFLYGIVHADLHPGNLHVRYSDELGKPQLIVLDHGCYKVLDNETRLDYAHLWKSIVFREHDQLKHYTGKFGIDPNFYQLFALFLTFSNFLDSSQTGLLDQRRQMSKTELKKMWKDLKDKFFSKNPNANVVDHFSVIENMFQGMKLDLILLLRTNIQIRSMTTSLGKPINRFGIMAEYCIKALEYETVPVTKQVVLKDGDTKEIVLNQLVLNRTLKQRLTLQWHLIQLRFSLSVMNVAFWAVQKLLRWTLLSRFIEFVSSPQHGKYTDDPLLRNAE
jgi:aarF domain-containing kinase